MIPLDDGARKMMEANERAIQRYKDLEKKMGRTFTPQEARQYADQLRDQGLIGAASQLGRDAFFGGVSEGLGFQPRQVPGELFQGIDPQTGLNQNLQKWRDIGLKGFNETRESPEMRAARLGQASGYDAASFGGALMNAAPQGQFRQLQMDQVGALQGVASGAATTPGQQQLQASMRDALNQQAALAATNARLPGMQRIAARNQAMIQQRGAGDMEALRLQERQAAQNALSQMLSGVRGADVNLASSQAGLRQQAGIASADAANRAGQFTAGAQNQFATTRAGLDTDAAIQNMRAQGATQGMDDQRQRGMFGFALGADMDDALRRRTVDTTNTALAQGLSIARDQAGLDQQERLLGTAATAIKAGMSLAGGK